MAAVLAPVGTAALSYGERQAKAIAEDPWNWVSRMLIRAGTAFIIGGFAMGTAGYFLKASATAAGNREVAIIQNGGAIFSNIKPLSFTPAATGTAPLSFSLQGIQNFGQDVEQDLSAVKSDLAGVGGVMVAGAEDIGIAIVDLAKSFLFFAMHTPDLIWDGLVWGIGGGLADVLNWLFPWLIIAGAIMLVIGFAIKIGTHVWDQLAAEPWAKAEAKWASRLAARAEARFDRLLGNKPEAPALEAPPTSTAVGSAEKPVPVGEPVPIPDRQLEPEPAPAPSAPVAPATPALSAPAETSTPTPPLSVETPVPGGATTEEVEDHLGTVPNRAPTPEELKKLAEESEANRKETLPESQPEPETETEKETEEETEEEEVSGYDEMLKAADAFEAAEEG